MKNKISALILINLLPAIIGVLFFFKGYISDVLVILLTPCSICLNLWFTTKVSKLMLWNIVSLIASGTGIIFSTLLYLWNISHDDDSILVASLFFYIWLVICISFILGTLIVSSLKQKKRTLAIIAASIIQLY